MRETRYTDIVICMSRHARAHLATYCNLLITLDDKKLKQAHVNLVSFSHLFINYLLFFFTREREGKKILIQIRQRQTRVIANWYVRTLYKIIWLESLDQLSTPFSLINFIHIYVLIGLN